MAVSRVGILGEGITQGPVVVPIHVARPALHRHHLELGAEAMVLVEQPRQLADRHAVAHGHAIKPDEGFVAGLQGRAFDGDAADRIGPVADDDRDSGTRGGTQAIGNGVYEGVDARADVLDVDHQHVDQREHLLCRLARLAVQREDRHVAPRILAVRRLDHVVLEVRAESVLRPEDGGQRPVGRCGQAIDNVLEIAVDRGVIGEHADAQALQARGGEQPICAEQHGSGAAAQEGGPAPEIKLRHWASPDFKAICLCAAAGGFETSIMLW